MYLFNFVLEHWVLSLLYILVMARIVFRFRRRVIMMSHLYRKPIYDLRSRWDTPRLRWIGTVLLNLKLLPVRLLLFLIAPTLWIILGYLDAKEQKRSNEEGKKYREQQQAERGRRQKENSQRAEARKQWLAKNTPRLYYNTVSGVTAVLRPADYAVAQKNTEHSRRDGFWKKDSVLLPAQETRVFVTKESREMIDANIGSDYIGRYKVAGWISQLDDIVESGIELVRAEDIFVPWVNETLLSFSEQAKMLNDCVHTGSRYHLVDMQAPRELQPIDY